MRKGKQKKKVKITKKICTENRIQHTPPRVKAKEARKLKKAKRTPERETPRNGKPAATLRG